MDLDRFVEAQAGRYAGALGELARGRKEGHWIWFVLPQLAGLGRSAMAERYGLASRAEAAAYAAHPLLGARYRETLATLLALPAGVMAEAVLGPLDAMKLRSSATLFGRVGVAEARAVLARWYGGAEDPATLRLLGAAAARQEVRMAKQRRDQQAVVERVMHDYKEGDLKSGSGDPVKSRRQAVAIALSEAGASDRQSPAENRKRLATTKRREGAAGRTKADLYAEAKRRGIPGRSTMGKAELIRALA